MYSHGCCNLKSAFGVVAAQSRALLLCYVWRNVRCTMEEIHCVVVTAKLVIPPRGKLLGRMKIMDVNYLNH